MHKISFINFAARSGTVVTGSTQDATYVATNVKSPQRPFLPWRTTATSEQTLVLDFLGTATITFLALIYGNFIDVTVQGNATDSWGAPSFSQATKLSRNPWNSRYHLGIVLSGFAYRYMRIVIAAQTPIDGAAYFRLGGIWAGVSVETPRHVEFSVRYERVEPKRDLVPDHEGWRQRLKLGEPYTRIHAERVARMTIESPGYGDELMTWALLDRQMWEMDYFAYFTNLLDPAQVYVVRRIESPTWTPSELGLADSTLELEEVVGP